MHDHRENIHVHVSSSPVKYSLTIGLSKLSITDTMYDREENAVAQGFVNVEKGKTSAVLLASFCFPLVVTAFRRFSEAA